MAASSSARPQGSVLVVGVDFRASSVRALRHAMQMLREGLAREAHVLHVLEGERARDAALVAAVPDALAELAVEIGHAAPGRPVAWSCAWAHVRCGVARYELRRFAFDVGADLLVVGARGARAMPHPQELDRDPLAPFSVLVAGDELVLDSRPFRADRCARCAAARSLPDAVEPWCESHARRSIVGAVRIASAEPGETVARRTVH